jgi:hypothetical protein
LSIDATSVDRRYKAGNRRLKNSSALPLEKVRRSRSLYNEEDIYLGDFTEDKSVSVIFLLSAQAISKG